MDDVVPARGVVLSDEAAREVAAALDHLGRLAAPRGMQLSPRLVSIRRELTSSVSRDDARADTSGSDAVQQFVAHLEQRVVDTATAARMLGMTPGGVAWLCRNGRLTATRSGRRWLVDTASLRIYDQLRKER